MNNGWRGERSALGWFSLLFFDSFSKFIYRHLMISNNEDVPERSELCMFKLDHSKSARI